MSGPGTSASEPPRGLLDDLVGRHYAVRQGELLVGGVGIGEIVERFGSPLFVYDAGVLRSRLEELRGALPAGFSLCYSVKANPNPAILRFFVGEGVGLEIASSGELLQALASGCDPHAILFAGPGKTEDELALAVERGVGEIHVESLTEARRLARLGEAAGRAVRVAIRVNPSAEVGGGGMRMGARAVPFGVDEDQLGPVVDAIESSPGLHLVGVHLFVGTQILDHGVLLRQYHEGVKIARTMSDRIGRPLETVDLGGGLGVPYFPHETRLDLAGLREGLEGLRAEIADDPRLSGARFILEPGRFLVAEAGIYVSRVTDVKTSRGKTFAVIDGGMHHHLAASGNLGQTIRRNFPLAVLNRMDEPSVGPVDVVGPLCTPLDNLGRSVELAVVEVGDLVGVFQSGAYGLSASPTGFLSRPTPAEVLVEGGGARLIRPAGRPEDYLASGGSTTAPVPPG